MSMLSTRLWRKVSWNVIDQALSALSNMALSIVVARSVDAHAFGAFAVAFLVFGIAIALIKSVVGQPLQMRFAAHPAEEQRAAIAAAVGTTVVLAAASSAVLVVIGLLLGGSLGPALVALAVVLPFLLAQDTCRMAMFTIGEPRQAAAIDAVWAAVQFLLLAVLILAGWAAVPWLVLAWGAGAAASVVLGLRLLGARPALGATRSWFRDHGDLVRYLIPEYFLGLGSMQLGILLVGVIATVGAVGSLRAAQVLLGPLGVLGSAAFQFAVPEIARRPTLSARSRARFAAVVSGALSGVTVVYLVVLLLLPDPFGMALFGDSWAGAAAVLLAMGLSSVSSCLANGPASVLYGLGQARATFFINLAKGPVLLVAILAGTFLGGAEGAAWGMAATEAAVLPFWILTLARVLRRPSDQPRRPTVSPATA